MNRRGVSLAETMLGVLLLGLVLSTVFNLLPMSLLSGDRASHYQEAQALADATLERLRSQGFASLTPHLQSSKTKVGLVDGEVTEEVFAVPGHDPTLLVGLRCSVKWTDRSGPGKVENEVWVSRVVR